MKRTLIAILATAVCVALAIPALAFAQGGIPTASATIPPCAEGNCTAAAQSIGAAPRSIQETKAAQEAPDAQTTPVTQCPGYVDADGDGVCDNYGTANCNHAQRWGNGAGQACPGFVDADGDGVCDNYGNGCLHGNGNGACPGYVDADGNGQCDNYGRGAGSGYGAAASGQGGYGHHGAGHGCHRG